MKEQSFKTQLQTKAPEVPTIFHDAMANTLDRIVLAERAETPRALPRRRKTLALAILASLLIAAVAAAAVLQPQLFSVLLFGDTPKNADRFTQFDLATEVVNGVTIHIEEAAYDGMSLYLKYTYAFPDVDHPLGEYEAEYGEYTLHYDEYAALCEKHNVGWWSDNLWLNGEAIADMPAGSSSSERGCAQNGVVEVYQLWRLSNVNAYLADSVTISLPIGERGHLTSADYVDGRATMPESGLISFTLRAAAREQIAEIHPRIQTDMPDMVAWVERAVFTPLMLYVDVAYELKPEAREAFYAENGVEQVYTTDDGETFSFPYTDEDISHFWAFDLQLMDGAGNPVFPNMVETNSFYYGYQGANEYILPYADQYPAELWLAPYAEDGTVDYTRGVRLR